MTTMPSGSVQVAPVGTPSCRARCGTAGTRRARRSALPAGPRQAGSRDRPRRSRRPSPSPSRGHGSSGPADRATGCSRRRTHRRTADSRCSGRCRGVGELDAGERGRVGHPHRGAETLGVPALEVPEDLLHARRRHLAKAAGPARGQDPAGCGRGRPRRELPACQARRVPLGVHQGFLHLLSTSTAA